MRNFLQRLQIMALRFTSDKAYDLWVALERKSAEVQIKLIEDSMTDERKDNLRRELERMMGTDLQVPVKWQN